MDHLCYPLPQQRNLHQLYCLQETNVERYLWSKTNGNTCKRGSFIIVIIFLSFVEIVKFVILSLYHVMQQYSGGKQHFLCSWSNKATVHSSCPTLCSNTISCRHKLFLLLGETEGHCCQVRKWNVSIEQQHQLNFAVDVKIFYCNVCVCTEKSAE